MWKSVWQMRHDAYSDTELLDSVRYVGWAEPSSMSRVSSILEAPMMAVTHDRTLFHLVDSVETAVGRTRLSQDSSAASKLFRSLLGQLAKTGPKDIREFYTPQSVACLMKRLADPVPGDSIYDPCSGYGELLASYPAGELFGQATTEVSWALTQLHVAMLGTSADLGTQSAIALRDNLHHQRRFNIVLANPPFNQRYWSDDRYHYSGWPFGDPPKNNANFGWLQHATTMLSPGGRAVVLMANSAGFRSGPRERAIRAAMVDYGIVEGLVALPDQLCYETGIPTTLWLLRSVSDESDRDILFIDATHLGEMSSRTQRVLSESDIDRIAECVLTWRHHPAQFPTLGTHGFAVAIPKTEIAGRDYLLTPRTYMPPPPGPDLTESRLAVEELRTRLARLHTRANQIDNAVDEYLTGISTWTP